MKATLDALLIGTARPFGPKGVASGIDKRPINTEVPLGREGFVGDHQGDRRNHGGPDKAIHQYPFEYYASWDAELRGCDILAAPGAFGENLSTVGMTEETVAIGDIFQLGSAIIEVSQGRQPCWKLNHRFGIADMAFRVQTSGRTGWYYRVVEEGIVSPGDTLMRIDRLMPDWPLRRLWRVLYVETLNYDELAAMMSLPRLPENWRNLAERRLVTRNVEDWSPRLSGSLPNPVGD